MPTDEVVSSRVCRQTGLVLTRSRGQNVFRVARKEHGPFNPPPRLVGTPAEHLSRWDTPGRTIYAGNTELGALIEVLSYITPDDRSLRTMSEFFDDVGADDELFLHQQIAKELSLHGGMAARSVSKGWREDRNIYEFKLPADDWFVDITASDSLGAIDTQLRADLHSTHGIDELQVSHLPADGAEARAVTTRIASWVRDLVLDDGSLPHGVVYPSKYGTDLKNYAVWLRRADDGTGPALHPLDFVDNYAIHLHTESFQAAVRRLRLKPF